MDSGNELRSPICLCLGDSEVGKSQLLSFLGCQNVTENNKKRFTQKIEICYLEKSHLESIAKKHAVECKLGQPGFLMVELPVEVGERTKNRILELSDVVVLVLNCLSSFTTYLIELISKLAVPCVIVLNKFDTMTQHQITEVKEKVKELAPTQKIVIVSALKGEGMPVFVQTLFQVSETLNRKYLGKKAECKVLDVKEVLGHGTLLLVVVVDGILYAKDTVVVSSSEAPIVSDIKTLWLPQKSGGLFLAEGPYDKEEEEIRAGRAVLVALKVKEKVKELAPTQKIVIVSALKGEGMPVFVQTLFQVSETLNRKYLGKKAECKVLDVKEVLGHGTLLLVVVVDGILYAKDTVVVSSSEAPIVSDIKTLWLPQKSGGLFLAEGPYDKEEEEIRAGRAVLVALKDEGSGSIMDLNLHVLGPDDDVEKLKTNAKCDAISALFQMHMRVGIPLG